MQSPISRRSLVGTALLSTGAVALAACGSAGPTRVPGQGGGSQPSGLAGSGSGGGSGKRTMRFQGTEYSVPKRPQRIVTMHNACLQPVLDVGGTVLGTVTVPESAQPPASRPAYAAITNKMDDKTVNAEKVLALNPDLILAFDRMDANQLKEIEKIADTVAVKIDKQYRTNWQERVRSTAELLQRNDKLAALEQRYKDRAAKVKADYADVLRAKKVVVMGSWDKQDFAANGPSSMLGAIYSDAGVTFAPSVQNDKALTNPGEFEDSIENLGTYLDADIVLIASTYEGQYNEANAALAADKRITGKPGLLVAPAGLVTVSCYNQVEDTFDKLSAALSRARN